MTRKVPKTPLIAIIGATGTGKSDLAVDLAKRHNGEIVNGDAMQLYEGLPIITNKITIEEQQGIPHHLLGCIGLQEPTWVVGTFVKRAVRVIEEIRARGKLPILVGGTHYYTQSVLFHDRLAEEEDDDDQHLSDKEEDILPALEQPTDVLLKDLQKVDPVMAARWHPNDRRKIQRSLEIFIKTGRKASDVYAEQQAQKSIRIEANEKECDTSASMKYDTLLFWIHAEADSLKRRLDGRITKMLNAGLLDEVRTLHDYATDEATHGRSVDETRGIWVSIGYKEFKAYVSAMHGGTASDEELQSLKDYGIERTQIATRQYAKRQVRWIRIKLLNSLASTNNISSLYLLDGSDISGFAETVFQPAVDLTSNFLAAESMPEPSSLSSAAAEMLQPKRDYDLAANPELWTKQHCEVCDVTCVVQEQWLQHVGSKAHKKALRWRRERERGVVVPVSGS
ncbi:tRNA dimethylallyltransferase, mitochondrial [Recurvomyces mirabilis]|uniref:tRNA dimethylallyltransferase n=1 Tax=Recurvomyces mirabilis TaxID=574656 RepID=A0AAE0WYB9_9PEZI|nr:tRNA dimethylallyltransferase, mitochondrial [Recurvomyces mirabilis]KAK5162037.1 tRNA dimethylallyltransferase, mitochondrial [Recurvomyces mirabilis]